ncbi:MAG TPA: VWA domain-containing protein [Gaiellales bacterium]|jgi:tight adherence protein B|nr:VWA domain-containing protein [Gaiellales bacterium]
MKRAPALLAAGLALVAALPSAAAAADSPVLAVHAQGGDAVQVIVRSPGRLTPADVSARLGRQWALVTSVHHHGPSRPLHLVFAVDTSSSMQGAPLTAAIEAGERLLDAAGRRDEVGLVAFSAQARVAARLTGNVGRVRGALESLRTAPGTALYDGVAAAVSAVGNDPGARDVVVVLSDGRDTSSRSSLAALTAALERRHVEVDTVGLAQSSAFLADPLRRIAAASSGRFTSTGSISGLAPVTAALARARLSRTYAVDIELPPSPSRDLHLSLPGTPAATVPLPSGAGRDGGLLSGIRGELLVALLGFAAVLSCSLLGFHLAGRRRPALRARLSPYSARAAKDEGRHRLTALPAVYDAMEERFAGRLLWKRLETLCRQAGSTAPAGRALLQIAICGTVLGAVGELLLGNWAAVAGLVAGIAVPVAALHLRAHRRSRAFEAQLPELLTVWASALRAGRSFAHALDSLVEEAAEPAQSEFRRAQHQVRLGVPVEQALDEMSRRLRSESFELVVLTTDVQRKVGGNIAVIFDQVAETVRKRQQFTARVRALTAMGKLSAQVLLAMPFVMAGLLTLLNRDYMAPLYNTRAGHMLIAIALLMMIVGALVLRRLVKPRAIA